VWAGCLPQQGVLPFSIQFILSSHRPPGKPPHVLWHVLWLSVASQDVVQPGVWACGQSTGMQGTRAWPCVTAIGHAIATPSTEGCCMAGHKVTQPEFMHAPQLPLLWLHVHDDSNHDGQLEAT